MDLSASDVRIHAVFPRRSWGVQLTRLLAVAVYSVAVVLEYRNRIVAIAIWGGFLALGLVLYMFWRLNIGRFAVDVHDGQLCYTSPFGERLRTDAHNVARVVAVSYAPAWWAVGTFKICLFMDGGGSCIFRLYQDFWRVEDLENLRATLSVPLEQTDRTLSVRRLRREFPQALTRWQAHMASLTVGLILALSAVLLLGLISFAHSETSVNIPTIPTVHLPGIPVPTTPTGP
jgi:hypothetical protein